MKPTIGRRTFMAGCSTCLAGLPVLAQAREELRSLCLQDMEPKVKPKLRVLFSHSDNTQPIWPNIGYDFEQRKQEIIQQLNKECPDVELIPIALTSQDQVKKLLDDDSDIDGYVCFILGLGPGLIGPRAIIDADRSVVLCDDLYGGTGLYLGEYGRAYRMGKKIVGVASSNMADVGKAVNLFVAIKKLQHSKILDVTQREITNLWGGVKLDDYKNLFGTEVALLRADAINAAYDRADRQKAKAWAERWTKQARKVVEPTQPVLEDCAAMYLGMWELLKEHQAQAIAVDCLGLYYSDQLKAYPCMGFFQFNNDGLVGACESDLLSTISMLTMQYLTGIPGFISDPVFDTSKNQIIYAHCVAANKVFGQNGKSNPFDIRSHSEDRKGAAIRSLMPLGKTVTTLKFVPAEKLLVMHEGETVENVDEDKACRTKLAATVTGDIRKMLKGWDYGWHRVTFYGDHRQIVEDFCALKGIKVVHEA